MGLLTDKYTADTKPGDDDVRGQNSPEWMKFFKDGKPAPDWYAKRNAIREILCSDGRSVAQGALCWLWARSPKTVPIPGFRTVRQVEENTAAMAYGPLSGKQMQAIDQILSNA